MNLVYRTCTSPMVAQISSISHYFSCHNIPSALHSVSQQSIRSKEQSKFKSSNLPSNSIEIPFASNKFSFVKKQCYSPLRNKIKFPRILHDQDVQLALYNSYFYGISQYGNAMLCSVRTFSTFENNSKQKFQNKNSDTYAVTQKVSDNQEVTSLDDLKGKLSSISDDLKFAPSIEKFLSECGLPMDKGYSCFSLICPGSLTRARPCRDEIKKIHINRITGSFVCQFCQKFGEWEELKENILMMQKIIQDKKRKMDCFVHRKNNLSAEQPETLHMNEIWGQSVPLSNLNSAEFYHLTEVVGLKKIKRSTLDSMSVRVTADSSALVFPYFSISGQLDCLEIWSAREDQGNAHRKFIPSTQKPCLFGNLQTDDNDCSTEMILTIGVGNCLALRQETNKLVVSLPENLLLPQVIPLLEHFPKIILWLKFDDCMQFARKLNKNRCWLVRCDAGSPLQALHAGENIVELIKNSRSIKHKSILTFSDLRSDVYSEIRDVEKRSGAKWSRFPLLTQLLKGHRPGELTVFTGPTGSGKTTFISEYSLDLCMNGVKTLWGSFEIRNTRLLRTILHQFAQKNLTKNLSEFPQIANEFEKLPMSFMSFQGSQQINSVLKAMSHAVYVNDINHIVIDNLQFMMGSDTSHPNDRFLKQDQIVAAFRKFSTETNCHVTIVIHPRKERPEELLSLASVFGGAKATQEADNVLILQAPRQGVVRSQRFIELAKNRYDGTNGFMPLRFDPETMCFEMRVRKKTKELTEENGN